MSVLYEDPKPFSPHMVSRCQFCMRRRSRSVVFATSVHIAQRFIMSLARMQICLRVTNVHLSFSCVISNRGHGSPAVLLGRMQTRVRLLVTMYTYYLVSHTSCVWKWRPATRHGPAAHQTSCPHSAGPTIDDHTAQFERRPTRKHNARHENVHSLRRPAETGESHGAIIEGDGCCCTRVVSWCHLGPRPT